jgi:glycosyltransferase involved in cell wall biosynthesis
MAETNDFPQVCIVIPTHYRTDKLSRVIQSIQDLDYPKLLNKTIVVANNSDKGTKDYIKRINTKLEKKIEFISVDKTDANIKRNKGIEHCKADYVLLLDDDVVIKENTLKSSMSIIRKNDKIAAIGYPVKSYDPGIHERLHFGRYFGHITTSNTTMPCTLISRKKIMDSGLFREDMGPPRTIHEDWEMGSRLNRMGYKVLVDGTLVQRHLGKSIEENIQNTTIKSPPIRLYVNAVKSLKSYINMYLRKHYWSFFEVMKSSPRHQQLEYCIYFLIPLLGLMLITKPFQLMIFMLSIILLITINSYSRNYYKLYKFHERIIFPITITVLRVFRIYLAILGLTISKVIN